MKAWQLLAEPENWGRGCYAVAFGPRTNDVQYCTVGAIRGASPGLPHVWRSAVARLAVRLGGERMADTTESAQLAYVLHWNDAHHRTYEEVVDVLKELDI